MFKGDPVNEFYYFYSMEQPFMLCPAIHYYVLNPVALPFLYYALLSTALPLLCYVLIPTALPLFTMLQCPFLSPLSTMSSPSLLLCHFSTMPDLHCPAIPLLCYDHHYHAPVPTALTLLCCALFFAALPLLYFALLGSSPQLLATSLLQLQPFCYATPLLYCSDTLLLCPDLQVLDYLSAMCPTLLFCHFSTMA